MPENTIYASDDTYISANNTTTNYDTSEILGLGYDKYITLLKFDLSSYIGNSYTINSATLYVYPDIIEDSTNEISIKSTTTNWTSSTVTWDTEPSYSADSESETLDSEDAWNDLDVTNLIQSICDEDIDYYGLAIFDEVDNSESNDINSSEHSGSYTPYLVIDYSSSGSQTQKNITVNIDGSINKTKKVKKILDVNIENSIVKLNNINKDIDLNLDNSSLITKSSTKIFISTIELSTNILTPLKKALELISYIDLNNTFIKNAKINISQSINLSSILVKKGFLIILSSISSVNNKTMKTTKNIIDLASIEAGINLRNIYRRTLNAYFNILEFRSNKVLKTNNSNLDLSLVMFKNNSKYINLETDLVPNINKNNKLFLTNSFDLSLNISLRMKKTITQLINSSLNLVKNIKNIIASIIELTVNVQKKTSKFINLETDIVLNFIKSNKLFLTNILNLSLIRSLKTKKEFLILINSSLNLKKKIFYIIESIVDALVNIQKSTSNIIYQNLSSFLDLAGNNSKRIKKNTNIDIFSLTDLTKKTHLSILSFFDVANDRKLKPKLFLTNSFDLSLIISLKIVKIFSMLIDGSLNLVKNIKYILSLIIDTLVNVQKSTSNIIYQSLTSFLDVASNNLKKIKKNTNINVFSLTGLQKKTQLSLFNYYLDVTNNNFKKARLPLLNFVDSITNFINKTSKINNCNANISNNNLKKIFLDRIINLNLFILLNKKINKATDIAIEVINAITLLPHNVSVFYKTITSNILLSSSKKSKIKRIIVGNLSTLTDVIKKMNKSINEFIGIVSNYINSNTIYVISRYVYYSETINKIFNTEIKNKIFNTDDTNEIFNTEIKNKTFNIEIKNAIFYYGDDGMDSFTKQSSEKFKIELNFEASLETGETISSYDLTIYNVRNQSEIDVTSSVSESPTNDDSSVYVTIKNGTNGYWYKITVEITTTKGNIYEKDVLFNVQEK